jgi:hypothetical protein
MNKSRIEYLVASEASLIRTAFMEGVSDGWHLFWAIVSAPFRVLWAFIRGKAEVSYTLRTH